MVLIKCPEQCATWALARLPAKSEANTTCTPGQQSFGRDIFEKTRWLGGLSARFGNYLLQQNKINWKKLAINQEQ